MRKQLLFIFILLISAFSIKAQTVELVANIHPTSSSFPKYFFKALNKLFFTANDGNGDGFFVTDGTTAGTIKLQNHYVKSYAEINGKVIFTGSEYTHGEEVWITDGTLAGTNLLKDVYPGHFSSTSGTHYFIAYKGFVYFAANDDINGVQLWRTDGTLANTKLFFNFEPGSSSDPSSFCVFNNMLYFAARDLQYGRELWVTNGDSTGTHLFKDIGGGFMESMPDNLLVSGNKLYFTATNSASTGKEIFVSDGTISGTQLIKDVNPTASSSPFYLTPCNNQLLAVLNDGTHDEEIWISDGTSAGTFLVADINSSKIQQFPSQLYAWKGKTYFQVNTTTSGSELWSTNGTNGGTALLKDITPGPGGSYPYKFYGTTNKLFFTASENGNGGDLWYTDGTVLGTQKIIPTNATNTTPAVEDKIEYNNALYMSAGYESIGKELYKINLATGIDGLALSSISLFPNPAENQLIITNENSIIEQVTIYNSIGERLLNTAFQAKQVTLNIESLPSGIYTAAIQTANGIETKRWIKM